MGGLARVPQHMLIAGQKLTDEIILTERIRTMQPKY